MAKLGISRKLVRDASAKVEAAIKADNETKAVLYEAGINATDREFVRAKLVEAAEHIRQSYGLEIPVIRSFLHEMLDVSV